MRPSSTTRPLTRLSAARVDAGAKNTFQVVILFWSCGAACGADITVQLDGPLDRVAGLNSHPVDRGRQAWAASVDGVVLLLGREADVLAVLGAQAVTGRASRQARLRRCLSASTSARATTQAPARTCQRARRMRAGSACPSPRWRMMRIGWAWWTGRHLPPPRASPAEDFWEAFLCVCTIRLVYDQARVRS